MMWPCYRSLCAHHDNESYQASSGNEYTTPNLIIKNNKMNLDATQNEITAGKTATLHSWTLDNNDMNNKDTTRPSTTCDTYSNNNSNNCTTSFIIIHKSLLFVFVDLTIVFFETRTCRCCVLRNKREGGGEGGENMNSGKKVWEGVSLNSSSKPVYFTPSQPPITGAPFLWVYVWVSKRECVLRAWEEGECDAIHCRMLGVWLTLFVMQRGGLVCVRACASVCMWCGVGEFSYFLEHAPWCQRIKLSHPADSQWMPPSAVRMCQLPEDSLVLLLCKQQGVVIGTCSMQVCCWCDCSCVGVDGYLDVASKSVDNWSVCKDLS